MVQISPSSVSAPSIAPSPAAAVHTRRFSATLATVSAPDRAPPRAAPSSSSARQTPAGDGNDLPLSKPDGRTDTATASPARSAGKTTGNNPRTSQIEASNTIAPELTSPRGEPVVKSPDTGTKLAGSNFISQNAAPALETAATVDKALTEAVGQGNKSQDDIAIDTDNEAENEAGAGLAGSAIDPRAALPIFAYVPLAGSAEVTPYTLAASAAVRAQPPTQLQAPIPTAAPGTATAPAAGQPGQPGLPGLPDNNGAALPEPAINAENAGAKTSFISTLAPAPKPALPNAVGQVEGPPAGTPLPAQTLAQPKIEPQPQAQILTLEPQAARDDLPRPTVPTASTGGVAARAGAPAAVQIGIAQPAARAFASAIAASNDAVPLRRRDTPRLDPQDALVSAGLLGNARAPSASQSLPGVPLDLRREDLAAGLATRIEALRDAADATNTRIRLVPDALGKIDVAIRREGETLHVHFAADTAATRGLLSEAQPRLADIASQRGLTLGDTTVGGGGTGSQNDPRQRAETTAQAPHSPRPPRAANSQAATSETILNQRLA